jgi:hypothetical protein
LAASYGDRRSIDHRLRPILLATRFPVVSYRHHEPNHRSSCFNIDLQCHRIDLEHFIRISRHCSQWNGIRNACSKSIVHDLCCSTSRSCFPEAY